MPFDEPKGTDLPAAPEPDWGLGTMAEIIETTARIVCRAEDPEICPRGMNMAPECVDCPEAEVQILDADKHVVQKGVLYEPE